MNVPTIAQEWECFRFRVMAADAAPIQRREMRLAFYAGFKSMLDLNLVIGAMPEALAIMALCALAEESRLFPAMHDESVNEDASDDS